MYCALGDDWNYGKSSRGWILEHKVKWKVVYIEKAEQRSHQGDI